MFLRLLGSPLVETAEGLYTPSTSRSSLLLFYLAYRKDWISRRRIAFFLRPEADDLTGRRYLRKVLNGARELPWAKGLEVEAQQLRWQVETDISLFLKTIREGRWHEALQLYRGPLLQGFIPSGLPSYASWLESERNALTQLWLNANLNYAIDLESSGQHRDAAHVAQELLEVDDLDEDALHLYLRNLYLGGQREHALKAGQEFYNRLGELELMPIETTQSLINSIRNGQPLEKHNATRRSGRRQSDHTPTPDKNVHGESPVTLPDSRILSLATVDDELRVTLTQRIPNPSAALGSIVELAESLIHQQNFQRAHDLLMMVLAQPKCDDTLLQRVKTLLTKT